MVSEDLEVGTTYRRHAVLADAGVGESIDIAAVLDRGGGVDAGELGANVGTLSTLVVTPGLPVGLGDRIGVNGVWVVVLGLGLAGSEAGESGKAEGNDGKHCGDFGVERYFG